MTTGPTPTPRPAAERSVALSQRRPIDVGSLITHPKEDRDPKVTLLYLGFEKSGKSTRLAAMPGRKLWIQVDPNDGIVEGCDWDVIYLDREDPQRSWHTFKGDIMGAIYNRELEYDSICVDSLGYLFDMMQTTIQMPLTKKGEENTFGYWDAVKRESKNTFERLVDSSKPFPGDPTRRRYNIAASAHLTEVKGKDGAVTGYRPAFQGAFKDEVGKIFRTVLVCDTERRAQVGGAETKYTIEHFCWTTRANRYNIQCGDTMGGPHTHWQELPEKVPGFYPDLAKAWGFPTPASE